MRLGALGAQSVSAVEEALVSEIETDWAHGQCVLRSQSQYDPSQISAISSQGDLAGRQRAAPRARPCSGVGTCLDEHPNDTLVLTFHGNKQGGFVRSVGKAVEYVAGHHQLRKLC